MGQVEEQTPELEGQSRRIGLLGEKKDKCGN